MLEKRKPYPALYMDKVMQALNQAQQRTMAVINFCQAGSSFNPFDRVDGQLSHRDLATYTAYAPFQGTLGLRQAIRRFYQEKFDQDLALEQICITAGATEALTVAFGMLTKPGGEIILAASHFPPFRCVAHLFDVQCRFAPVNECNCLDVTQLPKLITPKTQAIVVNSPSNPHGAVLSAAELAAIADLGVPVIFDEVYQALGLDTSPIPSAIGHCDRHLLVNSFSKSLSLAGLRIGYLIAPPDQVDRMLDVKATTSFSTNAPGQMLVERLLPHWDSLIDNHRAMLQQQWQQFAQTAHSLGLALLPKPQAGLYGLLNIAASGLNSAEVALALARDFAVGVAPSIDFQTPDPGFLRLNYAAPLAQIEPGLRRIADYLQIHVSNT
jgi:aspartate/methionine/tyrosine aminotransferase